VSTPPQPAPKPRIETSSAHNVKLWVKQGVADGRLKRCWNLVVKKVRPQTDGGGIEMESFYAPFCECDSFEGSVAYMDERTKLGFLRRQLNTNPVSCPKNCTMYENRKWSWFKSNATNVLKGLYESLKGLLKGYVALPWQTQVIIAVLVILLISPKWVPLIVSLLKAIGGK
jgi:hypothetical protein